MALRYASARVFVLTLALVALAPTLLSAQTVSDPALLIEDVATGFDFAVQMEFIGPDDILVLKQRTGEVVRVQAGVVTGTVLDVHVNFFGGHFGLMGSALHPQFGTNGWVYLYYSESSTGADSPVVTAVLGHRVYRYTWDGSSLGTPVLIADFPADPGAFHNGGIMTFGPDDKLYIGRGDQQHLGVMQNVSTGSLTPDLTSVILRINDDGSTAPGNPFAGQAGIEDVFAYGIRNLYGLSFDPVSGDLWDSENGTEQYDEINRIEPGFNSGWLDLQGPDERDVQGVGHLYAFPGSAYSDPEFSWLNTVAVTALEFFASTNWGSQYENDLFVSEMNFGNMYRFDLDGARETLVMPTPELQDLVADTVEERDSVAFGAGFVGTPDLDTGPDGNLYVLSYVPGRIQRIRRVNLDLVSTSADLIASCGAGEVCVTSSYAAYGAGAGVLVPSVDVEYFVDDPQVPANLVASFTDVDLVDGQIVPHVFCFPWTQSGPFDLIMVIDGAQVVVEDRETNNTVSVNLNCDVTAAPTLPANYVLAPAWPNPFNPRTTLQYRVPAAADIRLVAYDARGRQVSVVFEGYVGAGPHSVQWDATDSSGASLAAGVYRVQLESEFGVRTQPVTIVK